MATYNSSGRIARPTFYNAGRLEGDIHLPEVDDDGEFDIYGELTPQYVEAEYRLQTMRDFYGDDFNA